ncbi:hypothetical protein ACJX0J_011586, partial [Zea mays]
MIKYYYYFWCLAAWKQRGLGFGFFDCFRVLNQLIAHSPQNNKKDRSMGLSMGLLNFTLDDLSKQRRFGHLSGV